MKEANESGILVGICTTSNEKAVKTIVNSLLNDVKIDLILAGDIVTKKKPDPEIYLLALEKTGFSPKEVLVVEDSENGLIAGRQAGINVLVTVNEYTKNENLSSANAVISSLGDIHEKTLVLAGDLKLNDGQMVHLQDLMKV